MKEPIIRWAKKEDVPLLVTLCKAHAAYEKAAYDPLGKIQLLLRHLFLPKNGIKCLVVESNNSLLGYATVLKQFSSWDADFYYYMDCLYLEEEIRGSGYGKLIMNTIKAFAIEDGLNLQWQTPAFNTNAIEFYEALGAKHTTKERFFWDVN